jgi:hypothetical protein
MATVEEIKSTTQKTVVNGASIVAAAKKPAVKAFWKKARAYGASMKDSGRDHSR